MVVPSSVETYCKRLPINDGQLHCVTVAGLGDFAWTYSKFWKVCEEREVTFWFPPEEQHRANALAKMHNVRHGFLPQLRTTDVWALPGNPEIPDTGGVLNIHSNRHLENGIRIEKWYPELDFKNPAPEQGSAVYRNEVGHPRYVIGFMCHRGYMMGNLMPGIWARVFQEIEKNIAPVLIVGADQDIPFIKEVCEVFDPTISPVMNAELDQVYTIIQGAVGFVGVASGLSVLSTYCGTPTYSVYPRNLKQMPGTWEQEGNIHAWDFLDQLPWDLDKMLKLIGGKNGD